MLTDIEIAQQTKLRPIAEIAEELHICPEELEPYGRFKAKLNDDLFKRLENEPDGKLILVTAINPTPAGEGKTTTTAGLGQAMAKIGKKAVIALREPSLGPVFGIKGGAAGGGYAQVLPMEDINLHFTGDMHAITSANNLLCAMLDNHMQQGNVLGIDQRRVLIKRCVDMNDRALRSIVIGLGSKVNGIPREDVAIDCLVMAAATNQDEVREILRAVTLVKERLGVRTVLGVSNVSFGLPARPLVNSTFLAAAFGAGLDMPILNPLNVRYRDTVATFRILNGQDTGCRAFLEAYANASDPYEVAAGSTPVGGDLGRPSVPKGCPVPITEAFTDAADTVAHLAECVLEGRKAPVATATERLLETHDGLAIINDIFVPILDVVGQKYDEGAFFLPQLMASAEAVKAGFDLIRDRARAVGASAAEATPVGGDLGRPSGSSAVTPRKGCASPAPTEGDAHVPAESDRAIIVATVQGDIHDIGKNIVKMLLENYGFTVIDLGRDVAPEAIVAAARDTGARLIGLSALMTTTVGAMERTIALVHEQLPGVAVMVGGAVITQEFAEQIGADFYAKDAAASTRVASTFFDD